MILWLLAMLMGAAEPTVEQSPDHVPDPEAGQQKAVTCAGCHGADGNSATPLWPSLAGHDAAYLTKQLRDFRDGQRTDPLMTQIAKNLTDDDTADLAAWFASHTRRPVTVDVTLARRAEARFRYGWPDEGRGPCISCHGSRGRGYPGMIPSGFPPIGGQQPAYTSKTLRDFRDGRRTNDYNGMMQHAVRGLTDAEIQGLAEYIGTLQPPPPPPALTPLTR